MDDQQPTHRPAAQPSATHRRIFALIATLALAAATWLLYGSVCWDWWHYDDAAHLWFVIRHDLIWQYFAVPEVSRAFSEANLAPWITLIYRLIYVGCGMEHPGAAYAMQLLFLFAVALMTRVLMGLWVRATWAWLGAFLFLLGAPVMHVSRELMSAHYIQGLLFSLVATYGFVRALRSGTWWPAIAGGFCYLIAVTAKEIFVPLPILLLFLPEGTWKQRCQKALPFLIVLAAYVPWRGFMLNTLIGGYNAQAPAPDSLQVCRALSHIPSMLLGTGIMGWSVAIAGLVGVALLVGWNRQRITFALVSLLSLLGPLAPLTHFPGLSPGRYLFVIWWATVAACVLIMERLSGQNLRAPCEGTRPTEENCRPGAPTGRRLHNSDIALMSCHWQTWLALALWAAVSLAAGREMLREQRRVQVWIDRYEVQGRFLWNASSDRIFLIRPPFHVARFVAAIKQHLAGAYSAPIVIDDQADLEIQARLGLAPARSNATVWAYNESSRAMEDITPEFRRRQAESRARVREAPLQIDLQFVRHDVRWQLGPSAQGDYLMVRLAEGRVIDRIRLSPQGRRDATGGGIFDFFVRYDSPEGWTTYSPVLRFDRRKGDVVWRRDTRK